MGRPRDPSRRVELTCIHCGVTFTAYRSQVKRRYCSRACHDAAIMVDRVERVCAGCGRTFTVRETEAKKRGRYCSYDCRKGTAVGDPLERFWTRVDQSGECWIWTGKHNGLGYGALDVAGKRHSAHRFAYEVLLGPIPEGLELDHLCRNPSCVRPDHLEPVTHRENIRRGNSMHTGWWHKLKTHCPHGHPYDQQNTGYNRRGHRFCKRCQYLGHRRWLLRKRAEQAAFCAQKED